MLRSPPTPQGPHQGVGCGGTAERSLPPVTLGCSWRLSVCTAARVHTTPPVRGALEHHVSLPPGLCGCVWEGLVPNEVQGLLVKNHGEFQDSGSRASNQRGGPVRHVSRAHVICR